MAGFEKSPRQGQFSNFPKNGQFSKMPQKWMFSVKKLNIYFKIFILVINACNTTISSMSKWGYKKVIETSKVCGENGECISDNLSDFRCSCHPGFTGEYCEISKEN